MAHFFMRLEPPRPTFPFDRTEAEMAAMSRHADYWRSLAGDGAAIVAGPVFEGDGAWGLVVLEAEDDAAARRIADDDPVIQADLGFRFTVLPMRTPILRGPQPTDT